MIACSTAGGGVMFIPESIERKDAAFSYAKLVKAEQKEKPKLKVFGKRPRTEKVNQAA